MNPNAIELIDTDGNAVTASLCVGETGQRLVVIEIVAHNANAPEERRHTATILTAEQFETIARFAVRP